MSDDKTVKVIFEGCGCPGCLIYIILLLLALLAVKSLWMLLWR